jgi:DNA-binding MarR family transcriptional regulator
VLRLLAEGLSNPELAERLRVGAETVKKHVSRILSKLGDGSLSPNQLSVLGLLYRHGPSTPGEVAAAERQRPQSLTRVFAELEAEGLIVREPGATDRRRSVLSLTEDGRRALEHDMAERDAWLAVALETLSETERGVLALAAGVMERLANAEVPVPEDG